MKAVQTIFLVLFVTIFMFSVHGFTQPVIDEFSVDNVAHMGGEPNCVVSNGDYLYFSQALEFVVLSFQNQEIQKQSSTTLVQDPKKLLVQGNQVFAFSEWSPNGLQIIDITDPLSPELDSIIPLATNGIQDATLANGNVIIAGNDSLHIFSIADPQNPELLSSIMFSATGVAVIDTFLFVGSNDSTVIFNISDPSTPVHVKAIATGRVQSIQIHGDLAYIATDQFPNYGLQIYDISDPLDPQYTGLLETKIVKGSSTTYLNPSVFVIQGDYAYVPCSGMDTYILIGNISDPQNPVVEGELLYGEESFITFSSIAVIPNYLATTIPWGNRAGLILFDVSDLQNPVYATNYQEPVNMTSMVTSGDTLYLSSYDGLWVYKVDDFENPVPELIGHSEAYTGYLRMEKQDQYLFAIRDSSIFILDASDLNNIVQIHTTKFDQFTRALKVVDNNVYVITGVEQPGYLYHAEISLDAPETIAFEKIYDLPGEGLDIDIHTDNMTAYVAYFTDDDDHGIQVIDISNPDSTELMQTVPTTGKVTSICLNDSLLAAASFDVEIPGSVARKRTSKMNVSHRATNPHTMKTGGDFEYSIQIFKLGLDIGFSQAQADFINNKEYRGEGPYLTLAGENKGPGLVTDLQFWNGLLVYSKGYDNPGLYFTTYENYLLTTLAVCSSYMPAMLAPMFNYFSLNAFLWCSLDGSYYDVYGEIYAYMGLYMQYTWLSFATSVETDNVNINLPTMYNLSQNYPNPFNPSTVIEFTVKNHDHVTLQVFDIQGRLVQTLVNQEFAPGTYSRTFNTNGLASGVYFYRIKAGDFTADKKMMLVR